MDNLIIRDFSEFEGVEFWKRNAIVSRTAFVHKDFLETFPSIIEVREQIEKQNNSQNYATLGGQTFSISIMPKIDIFILDVDANISVREMMEKFVDYEENKRIFFTLRDAEKNYQDTLTALRQHNYNKYAIEPDGFNVTMFRAFPTLIHAQRNPRFIRKLPMLSVIGDLEKSLKVRNPPMIIGDFENLPSYEKHRIVKNWRGVRNLEPAYDTTLGNKVPTFFAPVQYIVEFSPFVKNENKRLAEIKEFLEELAPRHHSKFWKLSQKVLLHIEYLTGLLTTTRSKMDILCDFIKTTCPEIKNSGIIRAIYGYETLTPRSMVSDGIYFSRRNGVLTNMIYAMKFPEMEFWTVSKKKYFFDVDNLLEGTGLKNVDDIFYLEYDNSRPFNLMENYLGNFGDNVYGGNLSQTSDKKKLDGFVQAKKNKLSNVKCGELIPVLRLQIFQKRMCDADDVPMDVFSDWCELNGTYRPRGLKIINLVLLDE
jgi:hypothetical protein